MTGDILACLLIFFLVMGETWKAQPMWSLFFIPTIVLLSFICEVYQPEKFNFVERLTRSSVAIFLTALCLFSLPNPGGRDIFEILYYLFIFWASQCLWQNLFLRSIGTSFFAERTLVLGTGAMAATMEHLIANSHGKYSLLGFISGPLENTSVPPSQILGDVENIVEIAQREHASLIIIALGERRGNLSADKLVNCKLVGIRILDYPTFYERITGKIPVEHITPSWLVHRSGYLITPFIRILKKFVDVFCALILLLLCLPLLPVIALAIKLDSPGPVFYSQKLVGLNGEVFHIFKFRSMGQDSERETGAAWAQENDPRVTRFGQFMRRTRVDELPQLLNVLMGDMSFVGPRPERPEFVTEISQLTPYYLQRHAIKPGITGWAQVMYPYGGSLGDAVEKLRYDLYYINHLSLFLELLILFETIKIVLFRRGGR